MAEASSSTHVVKLPTAAANKVKQTTPGRVRRLAQALEQHPAQREQQERTLGLLLIESSRRVGSRHDIVERLIDALLAKAASHFPGLPQHRRYDAAMAFLAAVRSAA